ncbi:hypothetical protein [Inquilinus limosus]|uniref:hypothetical protein n=1 Tax=Inquilinus limosus TaxID=171674 RepID=UPI0003F81FB3|nr:hypothetical protein [Inquilinus limosus]
MRDRNALYRDYSAALDDLYEARLGGSPAEIREAEEAVKEAGRKLDLYDMMVGGHA